MGTPPGTDFGSLLRRYRAAAGLTQTELAELADIGKDTIGALERGINRAPHKETIDRLVKALHLSNEERSKLEAAARGRLAPVPASTGDPPPHLVRSEEDQAQQAQADAMPPLTSTSLTPPAEKTSSLKSILPLASRWKRGRPQRKRVALRLAALLVVLVGTYSGLSYWQHWWPFGKSAATVTPAPCYVYAPPTHTGGTITFAWPLFLPEEWSAGSWNPWFTPLPDAFELEYALWGTPYAISPCGDLLPDELAEIPTLANGDVSKDGRTVTMRLRPDLKWSDGQPITADDFAYWLEVERDPDLKNEVFSTYGYDQIASHQVMDAHTLVLNYQQLYSPFLYYLPLAAPRHAWGSIPHQDLSKRVEVNRNPGVTSGPFMMASYTPDQSSITMVPNPYYRSTTLHHSVLSRLVFKTYPDVDALIAAFEAGQIEYAEVFRLNDLLKVAGLQDARNTQERAYHDLYFNLTNPVLQDLQVRKAIEEAIDRCAIIKEAFQQPCKRLRVDTIVPLPSPAYDPTITTYPLNLVQARQDMQFAGWNCASGTCTRDGQPFPTLRLLTSNEDMVRNRTAELITHDLETLGIPVALHLYKPEEVFGSYADGGLLATGQFDLVIFGLSNGLDNYSNLAGFHSKEIPSANYPDGGNYERLNDPLIDHDLDQALITLDSTQQTDLYKAIQRVLIEKVYVVPLYLEENITLVSPTIVNQQNNPLNIADMWNVSDWFLIK